MLLKNLGPNGNNTNAHILKYEHLMFCEEIPFQLPTSLFGKQGYLFLKGILWCSLYIWS